MYGSQADSQLRRYFRIGSALGVCDEGHSHAAPAKWQCGQEAGQFAGNPSFKRQRAVVGLPRPPPPGLPTLTLSFRSSYWAISVATWTLPRGAQDLKRNAETAWIFLKRHWWEFINRNCLDQTGPRNANRRRPAWESIRLLDLDHLRAFLLRDS